MKIVLHYKSIKGNTYPAENFCSYSSILQKRATRYSRSLLLFTHRWLASFSTVLYFDRILIHPFISSSFILALWNNHLIWVFPIKIQGKRIHLRSHISHPMCTKKFEDQRRLNHHWYTRLILLLHYILWKIMSVTAIHIMQFPTNMSCQIFAVHLYLYVEKIAFNFWRKFVVESFL